MRRVCLISVHVDVLGIPILAGVVGEMLGGPAGAAAGSALGSVAADQINSRTCFGIKKGMRRVGAPRGARLAYDDLEEGKGFFKAVKKITGINKTAIRRCWCGSCW